MMNRVRRFAVVLTVLAAAVAMAAVEKVSISELVKDPKAFDGKTVEVAGVVAEFKQKTSRIGNKYFTFKLKQGEKDQVSVYSQGEADKEVKDGAKVKVIGVFREEKKLKDFSVKNEIDATKDEDKKKEFGVRVVK